MTTWKGKYRTTKTQNKGKERKTFNQKFKRSPVERNMQTHRNLIEIFRQSLHPFLSQPPGGTFQKLSSDAIYILLTQI